MKEIPLDLPTEQISGNQLIQVLKARAKPGARQLTLKLRNNGREYDFFYELKSGRFKLVDHETGEIIES